MSNIHQSPRYTGTVQAQSKGIRVYRECRGKQVTYDLPESMLALFKAAARALSFRFAAAFFLPRLGGMVAVCG